MRSLVFGRYRRVAVFSLLLVLSGSILLTGGVIANHDAEASGDVRGTVTNEAGEGIENANVEIVGYGTHLSTTNDSNGEYTLRDVPYDTQEIAVTQAKYENITSSVSISTTNSPVTKDVTLERTTGTISGTASSSGKIDGNIPDVDIEISHDNSKDQRLIDDDETDLSSAETTSSDGSYQIEVPTGTVELTAKQDGFKQFGPTTVTVTEDSTTTVDPDMEEDLTTVSGSVENTGSDSVRGATVRIEELEDGGSDIWPGLGPLNDTTDSNGAYTIDSVPVSTTSPEETRTIIASADTFVTEQESRTISNGGNTVDFELEHTDGALSGTVAQSVDGNDNIPLNGITVTVEGEKSVETNPDGTYTFEELPFGTHKMTVKHEDYEATSRQIEIKQGETAQADFAIKRTTDIELSIDSVSPDFWQTGDEVTVKYSFNETVYDTVDFNIDGIVSERTFDTEYGTFEGETTFTVPERQQINDGQYTVELSALGATQTESFEVSNVFDSEQAEFSETDYQSPAGDFVEVSISSGDLDEAYVMIGGDEDANGGNFENHIDVLRVSGDATFVINTRLVGSDRDSEDVYIPINGDVTSYAHSIGADSEPTGEFEDVSFENENGDEIATTLAQFRTQQGVSPMGSPLQANRYQLVAGGSGTVIDRNDGIPDFRQPIARSNLVLTQPEVGNVTIYTLPPGPADQVDQFEEGGEPIGSGDIGSLLGEATETDQIARGDRILIEVQSSGMYGALFDQAASEQAAVADGDVDNIPLEQINTLLERHEGIHIGLTTTEFGGPNHGGSTLQFDNVDSSDLRVLPDDTADLWDNTDTLGSDPLIGGFYIVIDTRGSDPFNNQPQDGDELTFDIAYESPPDERYTYPDYSFGTPPDPFDPAVSEVDGVEHFPYYGASDTTERASNSFVFEDPYIDYGETTLDGELIVAAEAGSVIAGETNIAPGSQVEMQLVASNRPNPQTITIEQVEISEDGSFEVTEDFSAFEPGERVEVEFYSQGRLIDNRLIDRRGVRVVDDLDNPSNFEIESLTDEAEVVRGQRLSAIETTIVNSGEIADRQLVEFDLNGETIRDQSVTLDGGEAASLDLSEEFVVLPVGEYNYTVRTEDDERTGQLTVTEPDSENETQINSIDSEGPTQSEAPGSGDPSEPDPEGLFGIFGIRSRDVAVAATVTGAMHLLGQWT
jgi:hypothetical protein